MAPVRKGAEVATNISGRQQGGSPARLTTTLYDLITVLQEVVGTTNDALVVTTVAQLMRAGRLTWCGKTSAPWNQPWPEATWAQ
jgi:hypothetical protein